ncbi:MAG: rhodanese-like domain-containing protein [Lachnospiraceae bacterium]|nr:rhodanese-like domain-containing protein [Lachnospiraceae bacterium]
MAERPILLKEFAGELIRRGAGAGCMVSTVSDEASRSAEEKSGAVYDCGGEDALQTGRKRGWLNAQNLLEAEKPLQRMAAAGILHEFLKRELGEKDTGDWSAAQKLKDLYDCRICVNHIAQVYEKGIMEAKHIGSELIFAGRETLSVKESLEILDRLFDRRRRIADASKEAERKQPEDGLGEIRRIPLQEVLQIPEAVLLDVRSKAEYESGHRDGFRNFPLLDLLEHPEKAADGRERIIVTACGEGYRSEIAARRLLETGYENVYTTEI